MWLKSLGLGLIQGWLWLFFLNGPLLYKTTTGFESRPETIFMAFLLFTSLSYLFIAKMSKIFSPLRKKPLLLILSMSLMTAGTLIVGFEAKDLPLFTYRLFIFAGTFMSAFGSAMLVAFWGERYSTLPVNQAGLAFGLAVIVGTVVFFVLSRLPLPLAVLITAFLPLFSLSLMFHEKATLTMLEGTVLNRQQLSFPFPSRLVILIILFYLAGGLMYKMIAAGQQFGTYETYWLTNIVYLAVCLFAGWLVYTYPELDLRFLYQPILPLLGVGFILFPVLHNSYPVVPFTFLQAGFALFDLYTWLLFTYLAARHRFSVSVIAWGVFLITSAIFTGELLFTAIVSKITVTMQETDLISLLAALLMFTGTIVFKGERETFAGWDSPLDLVRANLLKPNRHETSDNSSVTEKIACAFNAETISNNSTEEVQLATILQNETVSVSFRIAQEDLPEKFALQNNLTPREKQILLLLIEGRNNPYIRENLNVSNNTLKTHLRNIYRKLSINDRQELLDVYNEFKEGFFKDKSVEN